MRFFMPPPANDRHRTLRRFAWFPVRMTSGGWLWWEHYEVCQFWRDPLAGWTTIAVRVAE